MNTPEISEGTAQKLLHALVVAIRDGKHRYNLTKIASCYPRITNKSNPFLSLLEEIQKLQGTVDCQAEQIWSLIDRNDRLENSIKYYKGKCGE